MAQGTVAWINRNQGYGFISPEGGGQNVLLVDLAQTFGSVDEGGSWLPEEGERMIFDVVRGAKGTLAVNVREAQGPS
jgi:cold shock CspA family protein